MSQQEWLNKDFYAILGVSKDASADEIRKAYRKKARKLHPDRNPGDDKAEEQLKQVSEAYAVLNNAEQREQYDAIRAMGAGGARFAAGPGGAGGAGFEDLFGSMFTPGGGFHYSSSSAGGAGAQPDIDDLLRMFGSAGAGGPGGGFPGSYGAARKAPDINARTTVSFRDAALGAEVRLNVNGRTVTTRIPAGVRDGQKIRVPGKGNPGGPGVPAGDLMLTVNVQSHPVWSLDGANLQITVPISFDEAALGAKIAVPLLDGGSVTLKVPAGTSSGKTFRVRGKGITTKNTTGDLLVTVQVAVPQNLNAGARQAITDLRVALDGEDPRSGLHQAAAQ